MNDIVNIKKQYSCDAEVYIVKRKDSCRPTLFWNRVYDSQDNISYVIEIGIDDTDKKEYSENVVFLNENKASWKVPFDLTNGQIYRWRVKAFDGYEYSDYSKYQYIQYSDFRTFNLQSFLNVSIKKRKNEDNYIESEINVLRTEHFSNLAANLSIEHVNKFLPCNLDVNVTKSFLSSLICVKKRNYSYIKSKINIKSKTLFPPRSPLCVNMQSYFDYKTGNTRPVFSWWKSVDDLNEENLTYEIQVNKSIFFNGENVFERVGIKNPISEQMVYPLPIDLDYGTYNWRVRVFDGIIYSDWVNGTKFTIFDELKDLNAEIYIVNKFKREHLNSELFIRFHKNLLANVQVFGFHDLYLPSNVQVWAKKYEILCGEIEVFHGPIESMICPDLEVFNSQLISIVNIKHDLNVMDRVACQCEVVNGCLESSIDIKHDLNVMDRIDCECEITKYNFLNCEISEITKNNNIREFLDSEIFIAIKESKEARLNVLHPKIVGLNSSIIVYPIEIQKAELYVFNAIGHKKLFAELQVKIRKFAKREMLSEIFVLKSIKTNIPDIENPETPDKPIIPDEPEIPEIPDEPEIPETPEIPDKPVIPEKPNNPSTNPSEIMISADMIIESLINIKRKLYPVEILCEQDSNVWSDNQNIKFNWKPHKKNDFLIGYLMSFNDNPNYVLDFCKDYYEHEGGIKEFNAKIFDKSGAYYFHIQGFDEEYRRTPISSYKILYNNKPQPPTELNVNGIKFFESGKLISCKSENLFSWYGAYDKDENDYNKLKYDFQICNKSNFQYLDYQKELIESNEIEINFGYYNFSGKYYWRVRSFDGKEYSEWSKISSFEVNKPPSTPIDICFFEKKR